MILVDRTNIRYGKLIAISRNTSKKYRKLGIYWNCICDCGNKTVVYSGHLKTGHTSSCGCKSHSLLYNSKAWKGYEKISGTYFNSIYYGAKTRNLEFSITIEEIWELFLEQNRKCALTGLNISFSSKHKLKDGTASLDRIDSSKGYIKGNVQWVHKTINLMKWNLEEKEFFAFCKLVKQYKKI